MSSAVSTGRLSIRWRCPRSRRTGLDPTVTCRSEALCATICSSRVSIEKASGMDPSREAIGRFHWFLEPALPLSAGRPTLGSRKGAKRPFSSNLKQLLRAGQGLEIGGWAVLPLGLRPDNALEAVRRGRRARGRDRDVLDPLVVRGLQDREGETRVGVVVGEYASTSGIAARTFALAAESFARSRKLMYDGTAMASRMPMMMITTRSSIRVKPPSRSLRLILWFSLKARSSFVVQGR